MKQRREQTDIELDCRWEWWKAACDYLDWSMDEASAMVSGFMWGDEFDPIRGW